MRFWSIKFWLQVFKLAGSVIGCIVGFVLYEYFFEWGMAHRLFPAPLDNFLAKAVLVFYLLLVILLMDVVLSDVDREIAAADREEDKCQRGN